MMWMDGGAGDGGMHDMATQRGELMDWQASERRGRGGRGWRAEVARCDPGCVALRGRPARSLSHCGVSGVRYVAISKRAYVSSHTGDFAVAFFIYARGDPGDV